MKYLLFSVLLLLSACQPAKVEDYRLTLHNPQLIAQLHDYLARNSESFRNGGLPVVYVTKTGDRTFAMRIAHLNWLSTIAEQPPCYHTEFEGYQVLLYQEGCAPTLSRQRYFVSFTKVYMLNDISGYYKEERKTHLHLFDQDVTEFVTSSSF